ncbi:MAG: hypothetical protein H0X73_05900 [Chthoniobacterales bacterium]|nr:hypothetical protein [Chthoniobacterales bacterium]
MRAAYNFHIDKLFYAPDEDGGLTDRILWACGLRSVASVVLLVLLVGLGITSLLMQRVSADYDRPVRYVLVPDVRPNRSSTVPSARFGLSVAASYETGTELEENSAALELSKSLIDSMLKGSAFDPASTRSISAGTFGIHFLSFYNRIEPGFGEPFDRSQNRKGVPRNLSLDAPVVNFALSPFGTQYTSSSKEKRKPSTSAKTARTRHVKQKKKVSPLDAFFRSIRRFLQPEDGDKPTKARSAKTRNSAG